MFVLRFLREPIFTHVFMSALRLNYSNYLRYVGVALGYGMLDILLLVYIWRTDFQLYANKAVERSEATAKKVGR